LEEFPCEIAKVSMLLMKHLMDQEVSHYFGGNFIDYPIRDNVNIVNANALRIDWNDVIPAHKLNYIMGNPPFVGKKEQTREQKFEFTKLFDKDDNVGNLDYVVAWYKKAIGLMQDHYLAAAFVSTNSITQGEQAPLLEKLIFSNRGIEINFAYRTFKWSNAAKAKAAVHCVIVGFSKNARRSQKYIFLPDGSHIDANNINSYLVDAPSIVITRRTTPISDVKPMLYGSMPIDDGALILSEEDRKLLLDENPLNSELIRRYIGGNELLNNGKRWCIWLVGLSPKEFTHSKFIMTRVQRCKDFRLQSKRKQTLELANYPYLFGEIRQPNVKMLVLPKVSSENRDYLPINFIDPEVIVNGSALIIPGGSIYHFGVLSSFVHASWLRAVGGRLEMRYQYSKDIVYNTFPWPNVTFEQKEIIEKASKEILDARSLYPKASLADLYNNLTMPPELRKAHIHNDKAVWEAYGKPWPFDDEPACVAYLMELYQETLK